MEALNKKERNSAILRFSLWLIICVLIISLPIILISQLKGEQQDLQAKENEALVKEINFEREYFAVQIQKILDLMKSRQTNEINSDTFNAELLNIVSDIKTQTENELNWRGDMYRNVVIIAEYLLAANRVMTSSDANRDKQLSDLNKIIIEFENCGEGIADLTSERKRRDIYESINDVDRQFKKAFKLLDNFKAGLQ
jgi:transketolase